MTTLHETRTFHALAHDFCVTSERRDIVEYFESLLSGFAPSSGSAEQYVVRRNEAEPDQHEIVLGEEIVATGANLGQAAGTFVHHLNRRAISPEYAVMSHAGGVELDGVGFVFPAHMESGKTTLTTGLVRAGFAYLTDEAVAFDPATGVIEPFPKPLSIDAGSQYLFPELEPALAPGDDAVPADQWQVPPDSIRPGSVGEPCSARYVVFPIYEEDATTALVPMSRAEGLLELATNTFSFRDHPRRSLEVLGRVVEASDCYRLTVGDLRDACAVVADLAGVPELIP